ncbi:hypothetical protein [Algibacter aquimarinus]|uniref:Uncharacterized protein n=1 Tax=Algibacter aquimarinus TaxID=1136748 RepID=A0ABP9H8I5_9FLAO
MDTIHDSIDLYWPVDSEVFSLKGDKRLLKLNEIISTMWGSNFKPPNELKHRHFANVESIENIIEEFENYVAEDSSWEGLHDSFKPIMDLKEGTNGLISENEYNQYKGIKNSVKTKAGCTTQESIYEDNSNRSFLLYIDESTEQDQKIMDYQRLISAGKVNEEQEYKAKELLKNVQRLLKPIKVVNPFAEYLQLPKSVFKPRRTNSHYLKFIEAITFYKQYQREKQYDKDTGEEFIETTIEDIQEANELIIEVLLRKSDTINGATRNYLESLKKYLITENETTFTALEIRRKLKVKKTTQWRYHQ